MKYIIFDLEFTVMRSQQHLAETIEIGAIELRFEPFDQSQNLETNNNDRTIQAGELVMSDIFHSYVRPSRVSILTNKTTEFTGITQEMIHDAPRFQEAVSAFKKWLGDEEYYLCSWGPDDKHQFVRECRTLDCDLDWIRNYNDIQQQFTRLYAEDIGKRMGLKKSLDFAEIPFFGNQHNALDDAFNTAKLFKKVFPKLTFEQNNAALDPLYSTEVVYSSKEDHDEEEYNPFGQLAGLIGLAH